MLFQVLRDDVASCVELKMVLFFILCCCANFLFIWCCVQRVHSKVLREGGVCVASIEISSHSLLVLHFLFRSVVYPKVQINFQMLQESVAVLLSLEKQSYSLSELRRTIIFALRSK